MARRMVFGSGIPPKGPNTPNVAVPREGNAQTTVIANDTSGLSRRAGLRPMSRKRRKEAVARAELNARLRIERPWCEYPKCLKRAEDSHEVKTRARGGSILNEKNIKRLCRGHHHWVTTNPEEATAMGLMAHSWDEEAS